MQGVTENQPADVATLLKGHLQYTYTTLTCTHTNHMFPEEEREQEEKEQREQEEREKEAREERERLKVHLAHTHIVSTPHTLTPSHPH